MNIVQINCTNGIGSTGKIMSELDKVIKASGYNGYMVSAFYSNCDVTNAYVSSNYNWLSVRKNMLISRVTGKMGYRYKKETKKIIEWIDSKNPDIIHLHNIHGDWINIKILFDYIKKNDITVVWTLHDCWSFTGRCSHFEKIRCEKWKTGCYGCNNTKVYPKTYFFDWSKKMWKDKREWFSGVKDLTIITPSKWLAEYVQQSFLGCYPIKVIHNGINTDIYKPQFETNSVYKRIVGKHIVLGVANSWSREKGLDDFIKLDSIIDHKKYQIVLAGLKSRHLKQLPCSIVGTSQTNSQKELAELYSGADVFVNLTYQDNYPTTNLEAMSCGTPTLTYDTGGSPESVYKNEYVIEQGDIGRVYEIICDVCEKEHDRADIRRYAEKNFDKNITFKDYISLYRKTARRELESVTKKTIAIM